MAFQLRRDTEADARSNDPTFGNGEMGFVSDRNKLVVGDGSTAYTSLAAIYPTGGILPFGGTTAPDGFLSCDGSAVSRTTYADLFATIGTAWGVGDGSTTFNVPDLRGVGLRGAGTHGSRTMADGTTSYTGGSVGDDQDDQMQGHYHDFYGSNASGSNTNVAAVASKNEISFLTQYSEKLVRDAISDGTNGTPSTGGETRGATSTVLFVIKT